MSSLSLWPTTARLTGLLLILGLTLVAGRAQQPHYLKLQSHKLLYADTVYREATAKKDSMLLAEAYYLYGKTYEASGDLLTAHRWFLKSLKITEPRGDSFDLVRLYVRLSGTQENRQDRLSYAYRALEMAGRIHSDKALIRAYGCLMGFYVYNGPDGAKPQPDSVMHYYRKINQLAHKLKDTVTRIENHLAVGRFWRSVGQNQTGTDYLKKALELATQQKEQGSRMRLMLELASAYTSMGQPRQAWSFLSQAQHLLNQSPFIDHFINYSFESNYQSYYQSIGDWKRAYVHSEKLRQIERDNYTVDHAGAISRLNMEYKAGQKDALLKAQQQELALRSETLFFQQRLTWAVSALLLVTVVTSVVFFRLYRKNQRISARNAELVKEQNHRVKNNLQVVSSLLNLHSRQLVDETARKAVEESQLRVQAMALLHRRLYDGEGLVTVNLPDFIPELVESVIRTFGYSGIQTIYNLEEIELPATHALSLGLIVNELTTNACKYAFPDHPDPVFRVMSRRQGNALLLIVTDNGPGLPLSQTGTAIFRESKTFGMRLIQIQVDQLYGSCQFHSEEGTRFEMQFKI
ncbi:sensor histidine kinase [Larkinella humicola]|uniref:histidine kinase n=1 Tax=Larkinella humicola TaxID=2607654 RepID=A0A5N1JHH4_9BACT|nr:sensor histidine kinase [Larkinella humicola]KAA9353937.1 sensor histidine kinase [Larkinella humicola]